MKSLNNYITERLNPRHLGKSKFPIKGPINNVVNFLKRLGFTEFKPTDIIHWQSWYDVVYSFEQVGGYVFAWSPLMVRFADTSEPISESNPIYNICFNKYTDNEYYLEIPNDEKQLSEEDFLKEINKKFGF
jgi:hypothetical protein